MHIYIDTIIIINNNHNDNIKLKNKFLAALVVPEKVSVLSVRHRQVPTRQSPSENPHFTQQEEISV